MISNFLSFLINLAIGFFGIGIVVFIHEVGHFLACRIFHVDVETLSFGMGPVLYTHHGKHTDFCLSAMPFGGYCRIKGSVELTKALKDESMEFTHTEKGSFFGTTPLVRFLIFLAGPVTNFLLSAFLFFLVYIIPVDVISNPARVLKTASYPALYGVSVEQNEIKDGDLILSLDGKKVRDWEQLAALLSSGNGETRETEVKRDGQILNLTLTSEEFEGRMTFGLALYQSPVVGRAEKGSLYRKGDRIEAVDGKRIENTNDFYLETQGKETIKVTVLRDGKAKTFEANGGTSFDFAWETFYRNENGATFFSALKKGLLKASDVSGTTLEALSRLFGKKSGSEEIRNTITGPTRAAQSIGMITMLGAEQSTIIGLRALLYLLGIVSISIFIANLLPIPNFDGGQMLINLYTILRRRELSPKGYVALQIAGLVCTILILVFMYSIDIIHYLSN
jgi:RIP metalloprotease RseP